MRLLATFLLAGLAGLATAADPISQWRFGTGTIDGQPAAVGTIVLTGQAVAAAADAPLRLTCTEAPGITCILAAGSSGRFISETAVGGTELVFELTSGAIQVDVTDRGPYAEVRVRGVALDVRVMGTLFVVERGRADADFVALVRGKLKVGLRREVGQALGKNDEIELTERRGLSGSTTTGLGVPVDLAARPQVDLAAAARAGIAEQASGILPGGTNDWLLDLGAVVTTSEAAGQSPGNPLFVQFAADLLGGFSDLGLPPTSTSDTATEVIGGSSGGSSGGGGSVSIPLPPTPPPGL